MKEILKFFKKKPLQIYDKLYKSWSNIVSWDKNTMKRFLDLKYITRHEGGPWNIKIHDLYWNKKIGQYFEFFLEFRTNLSEYLLLRALESTWPPKNQKNNRKKKKSLKTLNSTYVLQYASQPLKWWLAGLFNLARLSF